MIHAGVVTFEPDIARLQENVDNIARQVDVVYLFDNGSANLAEIQQVVANNPRARLISEATNRGVAYALNRLANAAFCEGAEFLVTLDQDSVAPDGMVGELVRSVDRPNIAMVTPHIVDRNKTTVEDFLAAELPLTVIFKRAAWRGAITSGALVRLSAWSAIGGFDDSLFVDYVDYDFNQRLMLAGFDIVRTNRTYLLHEVGFARATWLRIPRKTISGKWQFERFYSFGHSPARCYYKARNRIIFTKKYHRQIGFTLEGIWQLPQLIVLTMLFDGNKRDNFAAFIKGIGDGIRTAIPQTWTAGVTSVHDVGAPPNV